MDALYIDPHLYFTNQTHQFDVFFNNKTIQISPIPKCIVNVTIPINMINLRINENIQYVFQRQFQIRFVHSTISRNSIMYINHTNGISRGSTECNESRCTILLMQNYTNRTIKHELGHLLGLTTHAENQIEKYGLGCGDPKLCSPFRFNIFSEENVVSICKNIL